MSRTRFDRIAIAISRMAGAPAFLVGVRALFVVRAKDEPETRA